VFGPAYRRQIPDFELIHWRQVDGSSIKIKVNEFE
jgi:hypothetical protein